MPSNTSDRTSPAAPVATSVAPNVANVAAAAPNAAPAAPAAPAKTTRSTGAAAAAPGHFEYLTVNPCKMCMPMGSITAAYGLRRTMNLLHGSQGCSTYIRRHMATHYNEPIDIASSSLTEQGAVYGGEENLHTAIDNLIRLYEPEVIAVSSTCLAETIGEDVPAMLGRWREKHPQNDVHLIPIATPGYGGTQFEGFFRLLDAVVRNVEMDTTPHEGINVVTGPISPADTRWLLDVFERLNLPVCLLPDASENLDGGFDERYDRLPQHGTSLEQIRRMAGARATVELARFVPKELSVATFLEQTYGVVAHRLDLPMGLAATDEFFAVLRKLHGEAQPKTSQPSPFRRFEQERARYLDALIDCHKYAAQCRVAIFGEPDFVCAASRMCTEVGVFPVLVATGSKCPGLADALAESISSVVAAHPAGAAAHTIVDEADFNDIEHLARTYGANILLGSSDGRRVAHKLHLPLVRCAFPVHDHLGGQRIRTLGYEGSLTLIDALVNHIIEHTETTFREDLHERYYTR
jgi:nitrogenase molybdenum-iron protein alpha/beta subunit